MTSKPLVTLALLLSVAALSCASAKKQAAGSAPPTDGAAAPEATPDWQLTRKQEIRAAWDKIGELRQDPRLGLTREPAGSLNGATPLSDLRQCVEGVEGPEEPAVSEQCSDVCNIKDAICDNAEDICRLADELEGDVWAADKCSSAKASCKEAKEICCGCIDESPATE